MGVPSKLEITIIVGGQPTTGMLVMLKFFTARKNPYQLVFGPSNEQGKIEVSRDQILSEARKTADLFPMDHWNIEVDWSGVLQVTPMNRESLGRALSAMRLFHTYDYGEGYEESLRAADAILGQRSGAEMIATARYDSKEPITVKTVRVLAA